VLAAAAGVGGYWMLHRTQPAPAPPTANPMQAQTPGESTLQKPSPEPAAAASAAEGAPTAAPAHTSAHSATSEPATAGAPQAQQGHAASVGFDPKALDPGKNTRLKIDLSHFPAGLAVTIEMNGKVYFKGLSGDKAAYGNLYVPPGTQQFRVAVSGGGVRKTSNPVQAEFVAKKRMTLKVELKPAAVGSVGGAAPRMDPATQVTASLKADHFIF